MLPSSLLAAPFTPDFSRTVATAFSHCEQQMCVFFTSTFVSGSAAPASIAMPPARTNVKHFVAMIDFLPVCRKRIQVGRVHFRARQFYVLSDHCIKNLR